MDFSCQLTFFLNGTKVLIENPDPEVTLLQYVRSIGLTGTKLGCGQGACGACTVVVSSLNAVTQEITHSSATSCLLPICNLDGKHVITIEGIGSAEKPHAIQERIALGHGSQCGFCTPGFVMSLYGLLRSKRSGDGEEEAIKDEEIESAFDGNLCRCTGYRPILDAAKTFVSCPPGDHTHSSASYDDKVTVGCGRPDCCQFQKGAIETGSKLLFPEIQFKKYDPTQELIFPPYLASQKYTPQPLLFESQQTRIKWYRPVNLEQVLHIKTTFPSARIIAGNTSKGIETFQENRKSHRFTRTEDETLLYVGDVPELRVIQFEDHNGLTIGAAITATEFQAALTRAVRDYESSQTQPFLAFLKALNRYAGNQIRNIATVGGTIALAADFSDLNPLFIATNATIKILSSSTKVTRPIAASKFFRPTPITDTATIFNHSRTILQPTDIIVSIHIPTSFSLDPHHREFVRWYKQAQRQTASLAIVNVAFRVTLDTQTRRVVDAAVAVGGSRVASTSVVAERASNVLKGVTWGDTRDLHKVILALGEDVERYAGVGGKFEKSVVLGFLFRFWTELKEELGLVEDVDGVVSAAREIVRAPMKGTQDVLHHENEIIGKPLPHLTAMNQATGEAVFVDDMPKSERESYAEMVISQKPHAKILSIDPSAALDIPGVIAFISSEDIPGTKELVGMGKSEPFFAVDEVHAVGQYIGMVIADSKELAVEAARLVKIEYEELPAILTLKDAISKKSYLTPPFQINRGDVDQGFAQSAHIFEGEVHIGGQDHFYLETHSARVSPRFESNEYDLYVSSQNIKSCQEQMARALAIPYHKIRAHAFGGKETRVYSMIVGCAVASKKVKRPVRCMYNRDMDMIATGGRHPFYAKWKVGVAANGKILSLDLQLYSNGGWSLDSSYYVMIHAVMNSDNVYNIANFNIVGNVCRTNLPSNTAMRGFGSPQGLLVAEAWMNEISRKLQIPLDKLHELNFYREGQPTLHKIPLLDFHAPTCYAQVKRQAEYERRRREVDEFNSQNKWRKRGLSILPTKHPLGYGGIVPLNQASAIVHMYMDGSVLLYHCGTEMGQGLNTKVVQVASEILCIPTSSIFISETTTDATPNPSTTGGSMGSDLNGAAVKLACETLAERLRPYREKTPEAPMDQIAEAAYNDRVNLTANGFYQTPLVADNAVYMYYSYGAAVTEVEMDVLSGDWSILRTDIVMDIGKCLNPALDVGQVSMTTLEEIVFSSMTGEMKTKGPNTYKLPTAKDIPQIFNISLVKGVTYENLLTINRSKGVGEPPLFLRHVRHQGTSAVQDPGYRRVHQACVY
ncbi:Molybdopterin-binding domain of aldehyde dehydrogenase-domain-containing protein [Jimgerdemannia flammicorona]|uniref:Molybdopterin-binding domain of aldehyde dehydrogenase-domain-containing protein n=1 Tax=Jimgerdemannia flammicorona TaxID=994334 RepID=A0A433D9Z2_9FUNG|nr:Molybdopterin-binding domain of aldehyde dehydrogenase-domain-containing protein [Jimgerdemannia flammicorona]